MSTITQNRHCFSPTRDLCWQCPDRDRPRRQNRYRSTLSRAKEKNRNFKTSNADFLGVISGRRYYSPMLGRWVSRDPIGERGGLNLSCFVSNSSVLGIDVLGMALYAFDGTWVHEDRVRSNVYFMKEAYIAGKRYYESGVGNPEEYPWRKRPLTRFFGGSRRLGCTRQTQDAVGKPCGSL